MHFLSWVVLGITVLSLGCASEGLPGASEGSDSREVGRQNPGLTYYTGAQMVLVTANIRYGCWGQLENLKGESCKVDGVPANGKLLMNALATNYTYVPDIVALQEIKMDGTISNLRDCNDHAVALRDAITAASGGTLSVSYTPFDSDTFGGTCTLFRSGRFGIGTNPPVETCTGSGSSLLCNTSFPRTGSQFFTLTDYNKTADRTIQLANVHLPLPSKGANIKASVNRVTRKMVAGANLRIIMGDFNITQGAGTFDDKLRESSRGPCTEVNASGWTFNGNKTAIDYIWLSGHTGFTGQEVIPFPAAGPYSDHRAVRVIVSGY
jgi:endonuclease/exonuclease/phosphatase family metal-dependent hydrolase